MPVIVHPDLGESTCSESAVRVHERAGWKRKADAPQKSVASAPAKKAASPAPTPNTNGPTAGEES